MKKTLTISETRDLLKSEKVFSTNSGFIFNDTGKYRPGLTFVLDSGFELDKDGKVVSPIQYVGDREVTDSFNLDLDGEASILFGDFWKSQKGAPCFRPKDPMRAKHLLVKVDWGGCFNRSRGVWKEEAEVAGALYFRRASSSGGGYGHDYWVLPVGYVRQLEGAYCIDRENAQAYCAKHSKLQADQHSEAERLYKEKIAAEKASQEAKAGLIPRLQAAAETLRSFNTQIVICKELSFDGGTYFKLGDSKHFYSLEEVEKVEAYVEDRRQAKAKHDAEQAAKLRTYLELAPKFEALRSRAEAVNLEVITDDQDRPVLKKLGWFGGGSHLAEGEYSYEALELFEKKISEAEQKLELQRQAASKAEREAKAKELGLPSDVRIWKRRGGRTGCSQGWVISANGVDRDRDHLYNENSRRAERYDEGYEIWNQILPGELVIQWSKDCTAADHVCEIVHLPEAITAAQLERVTEIQQELEEEWEGLTGLASGIESPSIGKGWLGQLS